MGRVLAVVFKALALLVMVAAPLLGVWVASSLAAYGNRRVGWIVTSGLLLFPIVPLVWVGLSEWRRRARGVTKPHILTFADRLVVRTLVVNVVFLGVLVASTPKTVFIALSARGDWFLRDHHGMIAERVRHGTFALAGGLEWLYDATHPNPYATYDTTHQPRPDKVGTPTTTDAASASASASPPSTAETAHVTPPSEPPKDHPSWPMKHELQPVVVQMPAEAEQSIESVGRYIKDHEPDPVLRVKALHDWVADRIAYDGPGYRSGNIPLADGDPAKVFERRLGVCAGYAQLLVSLGKVSGDEIVYVVGNVRTSDTPIDGSPHAWNAARIGGAWYLIDATFDAGYLDGETFHKQFSSDYLFTPPNVFGVSHFPEDKDWQLTKTPLTRGDFIRQPMMNPTFFARHMELVTPDRSQVDVTGRLEIVLKNPSTHWLVTYGPVTGGKDTRCTVDGFTRAQCDLPAGAWNVKLFGSDQEYGTFDYLGALNVNSH
jgi:transglutaminase-like putative cysteine protease